MDIALWKDLVFDREKEFSYLIFMKCALNLFELGVGKGRRTHTHIQRYTAKDTSRKLTLVIWAPKLEGFAFNRSAENVTSQRKKKK